MGPLLRLLGLVPGRVGEVSRWAGNISRKTLAGSFCKALEGDSSIRKVLDLPEIRAFVNSWALIRVIHASEIKGTVFYAAT